ncbi:hypothetical protein OEB94_38505, partial [Streptomyces sp. ICN988]|nr:hypothetical protein [Streptomyces sp. ICN988]
MPTIDRFLELRRDPHSGELLARGGDPGAHSVLQRVGFVSVARLHETYHRVPTGLSDRDEERLATGAVARLRARGYHVDCDADFDTDARPTIYQTLGSSVAHLTERIREATTTDEVAEALTGLTAAHDGILAMVADVLTATADFYDGLDEPADPYIARRLRHLTDEHLRTIRTDLADTRNALADRHTAHPGRSACAQEAASSERERSAVCACPPPATHAP